MSVETKRSWRGPGPRPLRWELLTLLGILGVYGLVALKLVAEGAPLGHDEAVYALKSRQMHLGGTSLWYWNDYRAPGLPLLLQGTWLIRGTEPFLRMTVWGFGALGVTLTWLLGRTLLDRGAGLMAAAGLALASPWLSSSTTIWPDVPGAVLGLGAIAIILFATEGERASWWVLAAGPLAILAVLVRYGALAPMGVGALAVMIWRRRTVLRSLPQFVALGTMVAAGSLLILTVPAVVGATTSPWSSIRLLQAQNEFPITQGIRDYIRQADFIVGGYVGLLFTIGLGLAALYAIREPDRRQPWLFLMSITAATTVILAIILHGEYRYLAPVYPLAWIIAGWGLVETGRHMPKEAVWLVGGLLALLLPINAVSHAGTQTDLLSERFEDIRVVSRDINPVHGYEECGIITSYVPQVAWYTECVIRQFEEVPVLTSPFFANSQADYMLLVTGGKRQPEGDSLAAYMAATDGIVTESGDPNAGNLEYAVIYQLTQND
jgi:4-amino-4-deoxy-L-arabinose transferase-like glycosyltransferase